jgi:hypothetical protein
MDVKKELENGANGNKRIYLCHVVDRWRYLFVKHFESWDHGKRWEEK